MLWVNFILTNYHFAVSLFGFVTTLILTYIFVNAFRAGKNPHLFLRTIGFLLLTVYLALHSLGSGTLLIGVDLQVVRFTALLLITLSYYLDPLQSAPKTALLVGFPISAAIVGKILGMGSFIISIALIIRIYRKYSIGLEREYKNLYRGFALYFLFELFHSTSFLQESSNVYFANLASNFGLFWIISHTFLLASFIYLLIYAWGYLRFELFSQIFGAFIITGLFGFIITSTTYTFLLLRQMQLSAEAALKTDLASFEYSIDRIRSQGLATAQVLALDEKVAAAVEEEDSIALQDTLDDALLSSEVDFLVVVGKEGQVLGSESSYLNNQALSLSDNLVVASALAGNAKTNFTNREWVNAPLTIIEVAAPASFGAIYTGYILDSAFVDGYKSATGLETSIYSGVTKSATTFVASDGVTRLVGATQASSVIKNEVLENGNTYSGLTTVFSNEYLGVYGPYKNEDGKVLGMIFVGFPSVRLAEAANASIRTTFWAVIFLASISFLPAYLFAKFVERHQS